MTLLLATLLLDSKFPLLVKSDSLNPRRPKTEEEFLKLKHHESTADQKAFDDKIKAIKSRRKWVPYTTDNPSVANILTQQYSNVSPPQKKFPNILFMLVTNNEIDRFPH